MQNTKPTFDAYIISAVSDFDVLQKNIPYIRANIPAERIFIVAKEKPENTVFEGCEFLDESTILDGMTYKAVAEKISALGADTKHTGWYFQQFIKLGLSKRSKNQYYLVWDCDTIPLHPIDFFDAQKHPYFNLKREYKARYFTTIKKLLGLKKKINESFISEHMMFDVNITKELLEKIEHANFNGKTFWEKILSTSFSINSESERNFSEFETYATFVEYFYKKNYAKRKLNTLRYGAEFFGEVPLEKTLLWCAKTLDTMSFEKYDYEGYPIGNILTEEYMAKNSASKFLKTCQQRDKKALQNALLHFDKEKINSLRNKNIIYEMDFIFSKRCNYGFFTPQIDYLCKKIKIFQKLRVFLNLLR